MTEKTKDVISDISEMPFSWILYKHIAAEIERMDIPQLKLRDRSHQLEESLEGLSFKKK